MTQDETAPGMNFPTRFWADFVHKGGAQETKIGISGKNRPCFSGRTLRRRIYVVSKNTTWKLAPGGALYRVFCGVILSLLRTCDIG